MDVMGTMKFLEKMIGDGKMKFTGDMDKMECREKMIWNGKMKFIDDTGKMKLIDKMILVKWNLLRSYEMVSWYL